jgi:hypothetical protein
MANSAGGILIYGIIEYQDKKFKHLPEKIDPINQSEVTKEWLEQVINTIRPKIDGIIIPLSLDEQESVIYIIEIPQSHTAHQARDYRYYKRHNFLSVPMEDYEIRDVMGRNTAPKLDLEFSIEKEKEHYKTGSVIKYSLIIQAMNRGSVYAKYVSAFFYIPVSILPESTIKKEGVFEKNGIMYYGFYKNNTIRDIVDDKAHDSGLEGVGYKYGPSRYDPILPGLTTMWDIPLLNNYESINLHGLFITWSIHADNAGRSSGFTALENIRSSEKIMR